jgi:pimeloyl-ACP methyl ester carboxylesterase
MFSRVSYPPQIMQWKNSVYGHWERYCLLMRWRVILSLLATFIVSFSMLSVQNSLADSGAHLVQPLQPCGGRWLCGYIQVPLNYTGDPHGFLNLQMKELPASEGSTGTAVIGLAGGPGQAEDPFAASTAVNMGPYLPHDDLIVFDQRGTGNTALFCGASIQSAAAPGPQQLRKCAKRIGPGAPYYSTVQSADDIDSIREALNEQKLVVYGVSYGTLVAQEYAQLFPSFTSSLVLDSVVPLNGGDPWGRQNLASFPSTLDTFCASTCSWLNGQPASLAFTKLISKLEIKPLSGTFYTPQGRRSRYFIQATDVINLMIDEATNPGYSQQLPAAIISASEGNGQLLFELIQVSDNIGQGDLVAERRSDGDSASQLSGALYWATTCEDLPEPWTSQMSYRQRLRALKEDLDAQPLVSFAGFSKLDATFFSVLPQCIGWPTASTPITVQPNPNIPVLVLHGSDDDLTPLASAQGVASVFPQTTIITVPQTGHDVLDTEPGKCGSQALSAFALSQPINTVCPPPVETPRVSPTPPLPTKLAQVTTLDGGTSVSDKILNASALCIGNGLEFIGADGLKGLGGFYKGYVTVTGHSSLVVTFNNYSCIKGTKIDGNVFIETNTNTVRGSFNVVSGRNSQTLMLTRGFSQGLKSYLLAGPSGTVPILLQGG